jgi:enoyl-CoA hydratase/carnithine racemase
VTIAVDGGTAVRCAELANWVARTVNRPGARNAISLAMMDALAVVLDRADNASSLVITGGEARAFISDVDLKDFDELRTGEEAAAMAVHMRRLRDRLAAFPPPSSPRRRSVPR